MAGSHFIKECAGGFYCTRCRLLGEALTLATECTPVETAQPSPQDWEILFTTIENVRDGKPLLYPVHQINRALDVVKKYRSMPYLVKYKP